jgi:hypothetical protein
MASTRNKNTPGNYSAEQASMARMRQYEIFDNFRFASQTYLPGNGLLPARLPMQIDKNNCDVESELFGIGLTNLENPKITSMLPPNKSNIQPLNIISKSKTILPDPLVISTDQRFQF